MAFLKEREKKLIYINVTDIAPNVIGSRRNFDDYELYKLSESIRVNGIIQPLTVRKTERGYLLVSGERRLKAAKKVGLKKVPCIVVKVSGETAAIYSITENLQRAAPSPFEQAELISRFINDYGISRVEAATKLGVAQPTLLHKLEILRLSEEERKRIISANLSERHARALIRIEDVLIREKTLDKVIAEKMTARECEEHVEKFLNQKNNDSSEAKRKSGIGDIRLFANSLNRLVDTMQTAGIKASHKKQETKNYIEYRIKIYKDIESGEDDSPQLKIC